MLMWMLAFLNLIFICGLSGHIAREARREGYLIRDIRRLKSNPYFIDFLAMNALIFVAGSFLLFCLSMMLKQANFGKWFFLPTVIFCTTVSAYKFHSYRLGEKFPTTFRFTKYILSFSILCFCSLLIDTHIEQLTGVSSGVFTTYQILFSVIVSVLFWLIIFQYIFLICFIYELSKLKSGSLTENITNLKMICFAMTSSLTIYIMATGYYPKIMDSFFNYTFKNWVYHDNYLAANKSIPICKNLDLKDKVVLLPNGRVSIANTDGSFSIDECDNSLGPN